MSLAGNHRASRRSCPEEAQSISLMLSAAHRVMRTQSFIKADCFFPGSLWPHACSTGLELRTHGSVLTVVKSPLTAVGSGFASYCVSILASGVLCGHGPGVLPLHVAVGGRADPCLQQGSGSKDLLGSHSSLCSVTLQQAYLHPW